jgi:NAD(P) transhydrogenase subunit beta
MDLVTLLYLVASVCFIQALKGLSHPTTSIRGNIFGMTGMLIATLTTAALIVELSGGQANGMVYVFGGLVVGGGLGAYMAQKVEMTKMPELVAFMHSMIGLAAVFIAIAAVVEPYAFSIVTKAADGTVPPIPKGNLLELFLGAAIGAITFSGSVIAFGKLSGKYKFRLFQGAPVQFAGQHKLNLILVLVKTIQDSQITFTGNPKSMGHALSNEALYQEVASHLGRFDNFFLIDDLIAHTASSSEGRMILSKRQESQLVLASLVHNSVEFKDARILDGVDIDRND